MDPYDASLKKGQSTTGDTEHLNDPLMHISGYGPVDGYHADLSSAQSEIQEQTALVIMSTNLLQAQQNNSMPVILHGDNIDIQRKCASATFSKLHDHRQSNHDLYMEYHYTRK